MILDPEKIDKAVTSVGKSFDTSKLISLMEMFEEKVDEIESVSKKHQVRGDDSEAKSIEITVTVKKLARLMDKARVSAKRPYLDFCQSLDGMVRPITKKLTAIEKSERLKCTAYRNEILKEQRRLEEEAKKAEQKKKPKLGGLTIPILEPATIKKAEGKIEAKAGGSASYKEVMVAKLVDIKKVPEKYLVVDMKKVQRDVNDGILEIPGIKIEKEMQLNVRS